MSVLQTLHLEQRQHVLTANKWDSRLQVHTRLAAGHHQPSPARFLKQLPANAATTDALQTHPSSVPRVPPHPINAAGSCPSTVTIPECPQNPAATRADRVCYQSQVGKAAFSAQRKGLRVAVLKEKTYLSSCIGSKLNLIFCR